MKAIDRAKRHYTDLPRIAIPVPEWSAEGEEPYVLFASALTVRQRDRIAGKGNVNTTEMFVDVLLEKAELKDGSKAFTIDDRKDLAHVVDSRIVSRIALAILAGPSDEDLEKNSAAAGG